jgi:hypothetical protein
MAFPAAIVSIAFDDGPYVASPTWTDVSSYVRSLSTDRSRPDDWGNFTGSALVELDNLTRLFDPFYTAGTYYGKLLPRRQIKIEATYSSVTYPVFRGFIDGWPSAWTDAGKDSTVTIQCYDALSLLSQVQLPTDWSRQYITNLLPRHYYTMDDPITPYTAGIETDSGFFPKNLTLSTNAIASGQLASGLADNCLSGFPTAAVPQIATNSVSYPDPAVFTVDNDFTISAWLTVGNVTTTQYLLFGNVQNFGFYIGFTPSTNKIYFGVESAVGTTWSTNTTLVLTNLYEPLHFAAVWVSATKTATVYINGIDVTGTRTTTGSITLYSNADTVTIYQGPIQQLVIWTYALTQANIQSIVALSQATFSETTGARVSRIIAETPFSASLVSATGTKTILGITDNAPFAGPELQLTAQTEAGPLYVTRAGVLTQTQTYEQYTQAKSFTSQATYGSTGTALDPEVTIAYDASSFRNALNVSMTGDGVIKSTGVVATTVYGQSTQDWQTYSPTVAQTTLVGNLLVGFGQYVYPAFDDFDVVLSPDNNWSATLGLELLERITLKVQPPTGNLITQDLQLSSIRHSVVPGQWMTTLNGSARWAAAFRLDRSFLDGPDVIVYTG